MSFEYNIPHVDFGDELNRNDGADAYFDIHIQLQEKLNLKSDSLQEEISEGTMTVSELDNTMSKEFIVQDSPSNNKFASDSCESDNPEISDTFNADGSEVRDSHSQLNKSNDTFCDPEDTESTQSDAESTFGGNEQESSSHCVPATAGNHEDKWGNNVLQEITGNVQNIRENKRKSDADHGHANKFISLAEGVRDFHYQVLRAKGKNPTRVGKLTTTIPQSPLLLAKTRSRPINYPSAEERIQKELDEMKLYKLKANPVNKKIFEPVDLGIRVQKTVAVEPFKLTEYKKKEAPCRSGSPYVFKAQAVPKGMLEHPVGVPEKKPLPLTIPNTPKFVAKHKLKFQTLEEVDGRLVLKNKSPAHLNVNVPKTHGKTFPCPFSFEQRDKRIMENKEEKIKKVLQEEKEARNFHANPVPNFIKKISKMHNESRSPSRCSQTSEDEERTLFRAQPALVLQKAPFKPKLPEHSFTHPDNVQLHTEQRALSRKEFDEQQKLRAEAIEAELRKRAELAEKREQEEIARIRQQAVHKAQPIRSYRPVPPKPQVSVTSPDTPNFSNRFKK